MQVLTAKIKEWIAAVKTGKRRSPFKERMVEAVPHTWEGTPYLDEWCRSIKQVEWSISDDVKDRFLKSFVVGTVHQQYASSPMYQSALVLLSARQGVRKSSKLRELFTGAWNGKADWYLSEHQFDPSNQNHILQMLTCVSAEVSETDDWHKVEQSKLKAFLSNNNFSITLKYENFRTQFLKRSTMAITGNFTEIFRDSSGSRRLMPLEIDSISFDYSDGFSIPKVWADALWLYKQGYDPKISQEEEIKLDAYKAQFQASTPTEMVMEKRFDLSAPVKDWVYLTYTEIYDRLGITDALGYTKLSQKSILAVLRKISGDPTLNSKVVRVKDRTCRKILCPPPAPIIDGDGNLTLASWGAAL